ncbi:alkaline phosphatase [Oceanotoga teriensis]|uniref:alkaline phosphatase n=1 Tax=Oceanotoga teriensis TaxID=515440 RepID=UPI002712A9E0|nr:alkaline phosphatase [Oceanotoga teriensis]MDO7976979.1 alkaline phosphatase [Oceanotoga teriensis]
MKKTFLLITVLVLSVLSFSQIKYVFFFIGDGMALPQINSAELYLTKINNKDTKLQMSKFEAQGMTTTYSQDSFITDSAAAGTALATGYKTLSGVINMNADKTIKYETIAERAKKNGMKVGIISSVSLDHATPAAFYAHQSSRSNYYEIAMELVESDFDFFGGGGIKYPKGKSKNEKDFYEYAEENGYKILNTEKEFDNFEDKNQKVIIINEDLSSGSAMKYDIDRQDEFSLSDITKKAINILDNEKGFFLMVEGGKIDWAGHANDAVTNIYDTLAFDESVKKAYEFYEEHPNETLIIVTGDHETGGMTIGFAGTAYSTYFDRINNQKVSFENFDQVLSKYKKQNASFEDIKHLINENFGLFFPEDKEKAKDKGMILNDYEVKKIKQAYDISWKDKVPNTEYTYLLYGGYEPLTITLTHILNEKSGISWTTYSHTGVPVATFAQGYNSEMFNGYYDNTDIAKKLFQIIG